MNQVDIIHMLSKKFWKRKWRRLDRNEYHQNLLVLFDKAWRESFVILFRIWKNWKAFWNVAKMGWHERKQLFVASGISLIFSCKENYIEQFLKIPFDVFNEFRYIQSMNFFRFFLFDKSIIRQNACISI